jgi:hypothetical protein
MEGPEIEKGEFIKRARIFCFADYKSCPAMSAERQQRRREAGVVVFFEVFEH